MEVLRKKRFLGLAGVICLILGTFFPYFKISLWGFTSNSLSLIHYWEGYVIIVSAIASALFIFRDYVEKYVPNLFNGGIFGAVKRANSKLVIIPVIIAALVAIYLTVTIDIDSDLIKHGLGFWVTWIGVILLVLHVILYKEEKQTLNQPQVTQQPQQPQFGQAPQQPQFGQAPQQQQFGQAPQQPQFGQTPQQPQFGQTPQQPQQPQTFNNQSQNNSNNL